MVIEIPAGDIEPGDILCDTHRGPLALASMIIGDNDSGVWVSTYGVEAPFTAGSCRFLPGETVLVQRGA